MHSMVASRSALQVRLRADVGPCHMPRLSASTAQVDLHALAACPQLSQLHLQRVGLLQPHGLAGMASLASLVLLGCTQEHSITLEVGRAVRELPVSGAAA
jgi:hypothetical protein